MSFLVNGQTTLRFVDSGTYLTGVILSMNIGSEVKTNNIELCVSRPLIKKINDFFILFRMEDVSKSGTIVVTP